MSVYGEGVEICAVGQNVASQDLCTCVSPYLKSHLLLSVVGHYGVFSGTRWRTEIQPRIREMIRSIQFKRRSGSEDTKVPAPYRALQPARENVIDWRTHGDRPKTERTVTTNGGLNGSSH